MNPTFPSKVANTLLKGYSIPSTLVSTGLPIYMDYQATTPTDPRVLEVVIESMKNEFGNPHSSSHCYGWSAKESIEEARYEIASLIGAKNREIVFTSGATEANNLAIRGVAEFVMGDPCNTKNHIITSETEHKCVLQVCKFLSTKGFQITYLKPDDKGQINQDDLKNAITPNTLLVSIMAVNNETGVIQNLKEIGKITRANGVLFHTDAAQAFGKIPIDVNDFNIDLLSISGHKIYATKGIGALYIRHKPKVKILPLIYGGGQEWGLRSGTLPTPLVRGLGKAASIAKSEMQSENERISNLSAKLKCGLLKIPETTLNGSELNRIPGNVNISFAFVEGESAMMSFPGVAVSSGSACTSSTLEPSYVLKAMGVREDLSHTSLRFGIGRFTTEEEIDEVIKIVKSGIERMRELSPLWEMHNNGVDISTIKWTDK